MFCGIECISGVTEVAAAAASAIALNHGKTQANALTRSLCVRSSFQSPIITKVIPHRSAAHTPPLVSNTMSKTHVPVNWKREREGEEDKEGEQREGEKRFLTIRLRQEVSVPSKWWASSLPRSLTDCSSGRCGESRSIHKHTHPVCVHVCIAMQNDDVLERRVRLLQSQVAAGENRDGSRTVREIERGRITE